MRKLLVAALVIVVLVGFSSYALWRLRMEPVWTQRCAAGEVQACWLRRTLP